MRNTSSPIRVPGDKSISHRALLFGSLATGRTEIEGLLKSDDVLSTWKCLTQLGVSIQETQSRVSVEGKGLFGFSQPLGALDCGNSGTTLRLLMGILGAQSFPTYLIGDQSLSRRPMQRVAQPLRLMGASIALSEKNTPPVSIQGVSSLQPITYSLPIASAQIKSALLLAGLHAPGKTTLSGQILSRDHTERLLPYFGCSLETPIHDGRAQSISIVGHQTLHGVRLQVPGDISSAAFWIALALITPNSTLQIENVLLNPSRIGFLHVIRRMGAKIEIEETAHHPEPIGRLIIHSSSLQGTVIDPEEIPSLIDELPLLAVLATFAEGRTEVRGAEELRVKETDRLEATASNLRRMGAKIQLLEDGFFLDGPQPLTGATLNSYHDHRIAMAFTIASLQASGSTEIQGSECVSISYPNFYETLKSLI